MAQLVERSITIPAVRGQNPVICKKRLSIYFQLYQKDRNKEKEAGNGPFLKHICVLCDNIWVLFCHEGG